MPGARFDFRSQLRKSTFGLTLALLAEAFGLFAAEPHYFLRVWQREDGLPQNAVNAIVQTHDGYLWLGTYSGLARFDGVRFVGFDSGNTPEMRSSRVTSLFEDSVGNLWIGCETGDVSRYRDGKFEAMNLPPAWNGRKILAMTADDSGDIWGMGANGVLVRLRDGLILGSEAAGEEGASLARDENGVVWLAANGRISRLEHGRLSPVEFGDEAIERNAQGISSSRGGGVWVASNGQIRKWKKNAWSADLGQTPWGRGLTADMVETREGNLAAATVDLGLKLILADGGVLSFARTNGMPSDWIRAICEDREGNLWVGTGNGLVALRSGKVMRVDAPDQWEGRAVLSVSQGQGGALWVGTEGAGLYRLLDGKWSRFGSEENIGNLFVWSVSENAKGELYAGTWGGGLLVRRGDRFERPPGLENVGVPMPALLHSRDGSVWVGTGNGLMHYSSGKAEWYGTNCGLSFPDVRAIAEDGKGTIWFGMLGGGLGRLKEGAIHQFRKADGLANDFVQCLRLENDSTLWVGTFKGGLTRVKDGHFAVIDSRRGLRDNVICDIEDDEHGNFWMSSHGGILRVSKEGLNRCADGQVESVECAAFDRGDGMPTLECSGGLQPAGCRTSDGRLWFPTSKGLVALDLGDVKLNPFRPPVIIEDWLVDNHSVTNVVAKDGLLRIPPGKNHFEFHFTALSFVAPEKVVFRYRLEGLETEWNEEAEKRSANYNFIPPGDYTFHVVACNNDGVWNETGATLSFTLLPHFWQTWWFRGLVGVAIVAVASGVVWFDTRRRMRGKLERLERQRMIEHERARIARDIHDDLGSHLTRITMLSESARGDLEDMEQAGEDIDRIYDTARELTRAMDEIVWAVNPKHDSLEGLMNYLEKFAQDFLATAGLRCRLDVPLQFPSWLLTSEVRHNLFLACKEALNNIVKHAKACEARFSLTVQQTGFTLAIEDDGCGFLLESVGGNGSPDRIGHGNGLENMRRRLGEVGGACNVTSMPGKGTKVIFEIPMRPVLA
jgi:signal transduction histidine kinase/ligand-binding sensor domain-containing protein